MSDLEKYLIEMRDALNTEEPSTGHMKRFSRKLQGQGTAVRRINFRHALQIAASVAIIMASGIVIVKSSKGGNKVALNPQYQEFKEATNFYAQQVNDKYQDISSFQFESGTEKEILLRELSEMDNYYKELLEELNANPGDETAMNALIQHYQIKLSVMDQIIGQLIQIKNINSNNYNNEKASI